MWLLLSREEWRGRERDGRLELGLNQTVSRCYIFPEASEGGRAIKGMESRAMGRELGHKERADWKEGQDGRVHGTENCWNEPETRRRLETQLVSFRVSSNQNMDVLKNI